MSCMRYTILGCGSSGGVPRIGGNWGVCDPTNPKNERLRCSLLVQLVDDERKTEVLVDSSPDLRAQLLRAGVRTLDGVVYTHAHADHVNGLDDLRLIYINRKSRVPIWADDPTSAELSRRFDYAFRTPEGGGYPPILELNPIEGPVRIEGDAGAITLEPFDVEHGGIPCKGFRVGNLAYVPDVSGMPDAAWSHLDGLECWIVDALQRRPHPTHSHLEQTLEWIARAAPKRAVLTNMHVDMDYEAIAAETPQNVEPAYDGMIILINQ